MYPKRIIVPVVFLLLTLASVTARADTYVIPFGDLQQIIDSSEESPDAAIRAYLAGLIRDELDALGFDVNGGLVLDNIPLDAITETIASRCIVPTPYKVHTDATTATVTLDESSSLTVALDSIRSIVLTADLSGVLDTQADAWVRWGQDVPFIGRCKTINTDNGWVGLTLPLDIDLSLSLDLDPTYDPDQLAIVVDKHAVLTGQAQLTGGDLDHDFGSFSPTDALITIFEDRLLEEIQENGEQAVADAITELNYRLDGLDENGLPDPTITPFNGPTVFALDVDADDEPFIRDLLAQFGVPEYLIEILDSRGIDILLQLAILEGAEREAYLAQLGAEVSCDVLLNAFETPLASNPIYTFDGQACSVADVEAPAAGTYYTDAACANAVAYRPTDDGEYCQSRFGDQAESLLGNAASWTADTEQPNDPLPAVASRAWTTTPSTQLDVGVIPLAGNHQPYMKQLSYKTVLNVPRGNGSCELEMRVYKSDITAENLKPLIAFHGGTWRHRGFSFFGLESGISHLTERGFIVFAPFYRLVDISDGNVECNGVSWREVTADAESALDWVKANGAALGAADEAINVYGQSAGAHLAAWLATNRTAEVRKALTFYGPTDVLEFLAGAMPVGGPYESFRDFGVRSISRFYGSIRPANEIHLDLIDFPTVTIEQLSDEWSAVIPDAVFDISQVDPLAPPSYLARCAAITATDLSAINLVSPPPALVDCLKQDLGEFLVANSFNHQVVGEPVPMHVVHGSGDTLVPYTQALTLCEAIDGNAQPANVVDPLTTYACGAASEVQIIKDADHALELGVCIDSLCPAGQPGSDTRLAVDTAVSVAWDWLLADPPKPPPTPIAIVAVPDINFSGVSEFSVLLQGEERYADIRDASTTASISSVAINGNRSLVDHGIVDNAGSSALAILATDSNGRAWVEVKDAATGTLVSDLWFSNGYSPIALAVLPDQNGNGVSEVAVLMTKESDGRTWVHIKDAATGAYVRNVWFENGYTPLDLEYVPSVDGNGSVEVAVLMTRNSDNRAWVHIKDAVTGAAIKNVWFEAAHTPVNLAIVDDLDANPGAELAVLFVRDSDNRTWVHLKDAKTGAYVRSVAFSSGFSPIALDVVPELDANPGGELAVLMTKDADGRAWVHVKDALTGAYVKDVWFQADFAPTGFAVLPDVDSNPGSELAVLGTKTGGTVQTEIKDAKTGAYINQVSFP